jgi:hypothetical protein
MFLSASVSLSLTKAEGSYYFKLKGLFDLSESLAERKEERKWKKKKGNIKTS